jgi:hypothetical protein
MTMAFVATLFGTAGHWDTPIADYIGYEATYPWDGNTGRTRHMNRDALTGLALRLPAVGAMMLTGDDAV